MGLPKKLTERQIKFAELLVYNEGRKSPSECAYEAGYKTRPRQAASELRNPKIAPLVVKYIGELRAEIQEKYGINLPNTPNTCLLYTSPSPRDGLLSRMPSSA